jgi:hypothetical protein
MTTYRRGNRRGFAIGSWHTDCSIVEAIQVVDFIGDVSMFWRIIAALMMTTALAIGGCGTSFHGGY